MTIKSLETQLRLLYNKSTNEKHLDYVKDREYMNI